MDFARFQAQWVPRNADQLKNQHLRFVSAEGRLITNLLISYDKRLDEGLAMVAEEGRRAGPHQAAARQYQPRRRRQAPRAGYRNGSSLDRAQAFAKRDREFIERHADRLVTP